MIDNKKDAHKHEYGSPSHHARNQQKKRKDRPFSQGRPRMIGAGCFDGTRRERVLGDTLQSGRAALGSFREEAHRSYS